jgi:hypothetical protein
MTNRSDCVLIQQASGPYKALLVLTVQRHLAYCEMMDMDYWPIFGEARAAYHRTLPHFDRVSLIRTALEAGYKGVIWLDADCVILGTDDMREAIPERGIGALWCESEWSDPEQYNHWCTGALYFHNSKTVEDFVSSWICCEHVEHGWQDQHAFNGIVRNMYTNIVKPISRHWHTILPDFPPEDDRVPQVVAFHGYGDLQQRYNAMEALFTGQAEGPL